jgi:hypothetical protein
LLFAEKNPVAILRTGKSGKKFCVWGKTNEKAVCAENLAINFGRRKIYYQVLHKKNWQEITVSKS